MAYSLLLDRCGRFCSRFFPIAGVFGAAVVLVLGGGCYTNRINVPPTVEINEAPIDVWRGQRATFTATASDPDRDVVTLEWAITTGACPDAQDPATWPAARETRPSYVVPSPSDPFCIWVFATDPYGATKHAHRSVDPKNHVPVARIDVELVEPPLPISAPEEAPLYGQLRMIGYNSMDEDDDPLSFTWFLSASPTGSTAQLINCADAIDDPTIRCLWAEQPGDYEIQLSVSDNLGATSMVKRIVKVADDQLPCLSQTTPMLNATVLVRDPKEEVRFDVDRVTDDGDPFPFSSSPSSLSGVTQFSWFVGVGMEPLEFRDRNFPSLTLPADAFTIGDEIQVRVEIQDRKLAKVRAILDACDPKAATCAGSSGCLQRVTWTVRYL